MGSIQNLQAIPSQQQLRLSPKGWVVFAFNDKVMVQPNLLLGNDDIYLYRSGATSVAEALRLVRGADVPQIIPAQGQFRFVAST